MYACLQQLKSKKSKFKDFEPCSWNNILFACHDNHETIGFEKKMIWKNFTILNFQEKLILFFFLNFAIFNSKCEFFLPLCRKHHLSYSLFLCFCYPRPTELCDTTIFKITAKIQRARAWYRGRSVIDIILNKSSQDF